MRMRRRLSAVCKNQYKPCRTSLSWSESASVTLPRKSSNLARYSAALAYASGAVAARLALLPWLGARNPYFVVYPAVLMCTRSWGVGPGVLVLLAGAAGTAAITGDRDGVRILLLLVLGFVTIWVVEALRRAHASAEDAGGGQVALALHANHRQVGGGVHPHYLGVIFDRVAHELDLNAVGFVHYVIIGQDVAGLVPHLPGAQGIRPVLRNLRHIAAERVTEEPLEEIFHVALIALIALILLVAVIGLLGGGAAAIARLRRRLGQIGGRDIDHGRLNWLGDRGERVLQRHGIGNDERNRPGRRRVVLGGLRAGVHQGADHDTDGQRKKDQGERQQLLCTQLVKETHGC